MGEGVGGKVLMLQGVIVTYLKVCGQIAIATSICSLNSISSMYVVPAGNWSPCHVRPWDYTTKYPLGNKFNVTFSIFASARLDAVEKHVKSVPILLGLGLHHLSKAPSVLAWNLG